MSSFTTRLEVSPLVDGKRWQLLKPFTYHIGNEYSQRVVRLPKSFITDFASIPRLFFFLPDWATYNKSAPCHDYMYQVKQINGKAITRKEADDIFLEAMLVDFRQHKSGKLVARLEYMAVRWFAGWAWRVKRLD